MAWEAQSLWNLLESKEVWASSGSQCQNCVASEPTRGTEDRPANVLSAVYTLPHLILMAVLCRWYYYYYCYYFHFTDEETEAERLNARPVWGRNNRSLGTVGDESMGKDHPGEGRGEPHLL